jgi:spore germination protein GerM
VTVTIPSTNDTGVATTRAVRELAAGGTNTRGTVTLVQGATTTPVADLNAADGVMVVLSAKSAPAAALGGVWISATGKASFALSHPSAPAGCVFDYEIRR